ncbi:MAG: hypothetical protein ACHQF4_10200 [Sphingobacteriales bacterium]
MLQRKLIVLFFVAFFSVSSAKAQTITVKRDTLYYLIDTAKTTRLDRILWIQHLKDNYIDYQIFCPCIMASTGIQFNFPAGSRNINDPLSVTPTYIKPELIKKIAFTSLVKLIQLAQNYNQDFNQRYVVFFIEHLPQGKYSIKKVDYGGPFIMEE